MSVAYVLLGWAEPPPGERAVDGDSDDDSDDGEHGDDSGERDVASARAREGPRLRLDWRAFAYAGKFVLPATGKAVARDPDAEPPAVAGDAVGVDTDALDVDVDPGAFADDVVGAVAFDPDRTDPQTLRCRYVTVRRDRRGAGIGARLLAFVAARAGERGYRRVAIAVNNPFAYEAAAKAGLGFAGEETGIAEVVCERPADDAPGAVDAAAYRAGLDCFDREERDLDDDERAFVATRRERGPPAPVDLP